MEFEWDEEKAQVNKGKHEVRFEEAIEVFEDEFAAVIVDEDHSDDEDRYIILGQSKRGRLLVVVHTYREPNIRLISARAATKHERRDYEEER
ncbi:MAG: BrnT family toxin [Pleurocapsa sp. SU_196_0]|nr:BrnT family toxin [Pleurocapsa sp. SU_196_0]